MPSKRRTLVLKPIYIRLRQDDIACAKREAERLASHYQTVIRTWVAERAAQVQTQI